MRTCYLYNDVFHSFGHIHDVPDDAKCITFGKRVFMRIGESRNFHEIKSHHTETLIRRSYKEIDKALKAR